MKRMQMSGLNVSEAVALLNQHTCWRVFCCPVLVKYAAFRKLSVVLSACKLMQPTLSGPLKGANICLTRVENFMVCVGFY
jgi:hypothetical protein